MFCTSVAKVIRCTFQNLRREKEMERETLYCFKPPIITTINKSCAQLITETTELGRSGQIPPPLHDCVYSLHASLPTPSTRNATVSATPLPKDILYANLMWPFLVLVSLDSVGSSRFVAHNAQLWVLRIEMDSGQSFTN